MRILPFDIGDLTFVHVEGDPDLEKKASAKWVSISDRAMEKWKNAPTKWCDDGASSGYITVTFAVFKEDELWGTWGLYRLESANDENTCFRCRMAPMIPDVIEGDMENPPDLTRVRSIIAYFLANDIETDTGASFCVVTRRNPTESDEVANGQEWNNIANMDDSLTMHDDDLTGDNAIRMGVE